MPTIDDISPDRATYRPGDTAQVRVTLTNGGTTELHGRLTLSLVDITEQVLAAEQAVTLQPGTTSTVTLSVEPPPAALHGYGLDATLYAEDGSVLAEGSGALDVLERWSQAPRYGFLSDFGPEQTAEDIAERADSLGRYHLNVVQFYDWMWRHYKLLPPTNEEEFTDALDRRLSLRAVREAIEAVQQRGGAAMAYGAVYGAEPEFADAHPELRLYEEDGKPISLAELFYIMNIDPDSPWVPLIVEEFADAVRSLDFDGIHLDQYGFPKTAVNSAGETVDLSGHFPVLIDRARAAVVAEKPSAGVIFNAVTNWPIETVAPTTQDSVYIEVWPPYETYNDLRSLITEGKRLSGGKPVILAAYLSPFLDAPADTLPGCEAAALLSTAAIYASGGSHLLLGERDGILCDPYYPKYATLRSQFVPTMRAYYDFLVRYEQLLSAPDVQDYGYAGPDGEGQANVAGAGNVEVSSTAKAGAVWAVQRRKPGYHVVHLLNLTDQAGTAWNALRTPPSPITELDLQLGGLPPVRQVLAASPDFRMGRPQPVEWAQEGGQLRVRLPQLHVWTALICLMEGES